jgi:hypothetical protein
LAGLIDELSAGAWLLLLDVDIFLQVRPLGAYL